MKQRIDLENWDRKEHFNFFRQFDEPYYGVCVTVDCTAAYRNAKERGVSFFLYYLYKSLQAAQDIEPFRLRVNGDEVYLYDHTVAGPTISRPNGTFGYGYIPYNPSFEDYLIQSKQEIERVRSLKKLELSNGENLIYYSTLPNVNFTSLSHARMFSFALSHPMITFGKMTEENGRKSMPVSIHVNHALVDGVQVGNYVDRFQELMNNK